MTLAVLEIDFIDDPPSRDGWGWGYCPDTRPPAPPTPPERPRDRIVKHRPHRCSRCGGLQHNSRTCRERT
jgi:hypothetical protein